RRGRERRGDAAHELRVARAHPRAVPGRRLDDLPEPRRDPGGPPAAHHGRARGAAGGHRGRRAVDARVSRAPALLTRPHGRDHYARAPNDCDIMLDEQTTGPDLLPERPPEHSVDALVAGGGMAGASAAATLSAMRWNVLLVEPGLDPAKRLAGELIHPPGVSDLAELGLL